MSEKELTELSEKLSYGILEAQRRLFERKMKLGETVIVADKDGMPIEIPAEQALRAAEARLRSMTTPALHRDQEY